jgi:hypothetical protein
MVVLYTPNAEEVRAFIRDKLGFVHNEIGRGWLIFDVPEVDLGCPSLRQGLPFDLSLCDDIHQTVEGLRSRASNSLQVSLTKNGAC